MTATLRDKLKAFDPDLPLERAGTIPSLWYFDPEIHAAEKETLFSDTWQVVGRGAQVAQPGSYLTADVAGEPVLVTRDESGVLRAFSNVCRHRAAPLATDSEGAASKLRCRYHGWTYDLAGRLIGTPEFDGVEGFRRDENGLAPLAVDTWGPLVFVHGGSNPPPLAQFLAPMPDHAEAMELDSLRFVQRREYELRCNWKVFVDNYLDGGYHVNTIHQSLAGVLDYAGYRTENAGFTNLQSSPMRQPDSSREDASAESVRAGRTAYYWWLFPNFMLNNYAGVMDTNLVLPLGPDRCRVFFDFYFSRTEGPEAERFIEESIRVSDRIQIEDIEICEQVQHGLASRSFDTGRFSVRRESGGHRFHQLLARTLRAGSGMS